MKLSDVKGEEAVFTAVADLIDPITAMMADEKVKDVFTGDESKRKKGETNKSYVIRSWSAKIPYMLKNHRNELVRILAVLAQKTDEEYKEGFTLATLIYDLLDLLNDDALIALFMSAAPKVGSMPPTDS